MVKELAPEVVKQVLVIKGVERIESIVTRDAVRVPAKFYTWQCSRLIRRDYYLMCSKMFLLARKETTSARIGRRLQDLISEGKAIGALVPAPAVLDDSEATEMTIRTVSSEARLLLNLLIAFDLAMANLLLVHGTENTMQKCVPFFAAYGRLKQALFKAKPEQSKVESVDEVPAEVQPQSGYTPTTFGTNLSCMLGRLMLRLKSKPN